MNYIDVAQLNKDIIDWQTRLPRNLDLIVGIPRSGLLAASLLSLYLNLPLTDVEGLKNGRVLTGGKRINSIESSNKTKPNLNVLIIDDSLNSGNQLNLVKASILRSNLTYNFYYSAVYITPGQEKSVDYYYKIVSSPRIFQWNLMNSHVIQNSCVDIDGVLCVDPTEEENDEGERYIHFLMNAKPFWLPKVKIKALVTCRLEQYRELTEAWLKKNNILYDSLYMMNLSDKRARLDYGHARFKAEIFKKAKTKFFIESSLVQAEEIVNLTYKPVFCVETMNFLHYDEPKFKKYCKSILHSVLPDKIYQRFATLYQKNR
jgi:uncharacterized HAD superfamily protein